ncbi:MAG TPA: response regulator [Polyangia bacterium]|jgi:CheY-like chemotaxis protein|nr:response regulator [Polyangia bacterium]
MPETTPHPMAKSVLLVEDDRDIRESLIELLDGEGYLTIAVENGRDALAHLARIRPCLIIADYLMPDMNGTDLVKAVQGQETLRDIPILILTAASKHMMGGDVTVPVLTKPVTIAALLAVLREHCGIRSAA